MSNIKEIKNRMESVRDMQKITNAMYLIASAKLQKAKSSLNHTRPYFNAIQKEIKRVFRVEAELENKYFYPSTGEHDFDGAYGYLVITADKGLAGAYNQNVIKRAMSLMSMHDNPKLFVVGEYGRRYFETHNIPIEESFLYTAQNPTIHRARQITNLLLDRYNSGELKKIFVVYTDFENGFKSSVSDFRLLPFHRADFMPHSDEKSADESFEFLNSLETVLNNIVPSYVTGYIYSVLTDSFCSEQSARMNAMNAANENTKEILEELSKRYNHERQGIITGEITEIATASKHQQNGEV